MHALSDPVTTQLVASVGAVLVQAIASAAVVLAVVVPLQLNGRRKTVAAARASTEAAMEAKEAITNGHQEHIRDTLDRFHRETTEAIAGVRTEIVNEMGGMKSDVRGIRRDIGRVVDRVDRHDVTLAELNHKLKE